MAPEDNFADLHHFTWCAQVAVKAEFRDWRNSPKTAIHLFLIRWLKTAQAQKRFPHTVARDINYLIHYGHRNGPDANLLSQVEFLYDSCEDTTLQSELFRLTYVIELLKDRQWTAGIQSEREWKKNIRGKGNALHLPPTMSTQFDDNGWLLTPLSLRIGGNTDSALNLLAQYRLEVGIIDAATGEFVLRSRHGE